ncbi:fatty acid--CoA ligase [Endozoicomonas sp. OPT23]|uniref:FadD3 family acyl-CoA ligase n=1 Tax=Endozoicomonas sp. OPT23 TaxID=2072845 RepID=UPI00129ACB8A|nr:FadD3 family acyl-CoA ligase [Endozoicomonas sp. OPT23]MRI34024.1 fatty acid--CoA ligase [Endozoicomonas sp. OPT23]
MADVTQCQTIPQLIDFVADQYQDRSAIEDEGHIISYSQLNELRRQAAAALLVMNVQQGDRVAVWAPNIWEWVVAATALQTVGAALVPLNTRMKGSEAGYVLKASGARVLFSIGDFLGADYPAMLISEDLPELEQIVLFRQETSAHPVAISWSAFLQKAEGIDQQQVEQRQSMVTSETMSDLLFTSGTTGKPKGVITQHAQNLKVVADWGEVVGIEESDRYLIVNPFFHSFGYKAGWLAALMRGCTILPLQVFDVPTILQKVSDEKITVLPGPPTLYQSILSHPQRDSFDISSLRVAVTGAAAIPVSMIREMDEVLGFDTIITAYGLTEVCGFGTICRQGDSPELIANTSGRAMPDVEVRCIDEFGHEVRRGTPGEVVIRGHNVMQGYFNNEAATQETVDKDGWLHTGDIGIMDSLGYLRITDRMKDMIISGGFNVYPAEIENHMNSHKAIAQVSVVGVPDERLGEVGMAWVITKQDDQLNQDELIQWCRAEMANYKVPRYVQFVDSLPLNASGKVMKFELRDRATELLKN